MAMRQNMRRTRTRIAKRHGQTGPATLGPLQARASYLRINVIRQFSFSEVSVVISLIFGKKNTGPMIKKARLLFM
jgi:hypothetical protein